MSPSNIEFPRSRAYNCVPPTSGWKLTFSTSDNKYKLDHIKLQEPCLKSSTLTIYIDSSCQHFFPFSGSSIPKITQENQAHEQRTSKPLTLQEGICWFETFTLHLKYVPALWDYPRSHVCIMAQVENASVLFPVLDLLWNGFILRIHRKHFGIY